MEGEIVKRRGTIEEQRLVRDQKHDTTEQRQCMKSEGE
jgi:hypothetical protein